MSTVADVAGGGDDAADGAADGDADRGSADPFAGGHIEVPESAMRAISPAAWLGGLKRRVDDLATRLTYGR